MEVSIGVFLGDWSGAPRSFAEEGYRINMRAMTYTIAALASAGIMIGISVMPTPVPSSTTPSSGRSVPDDQPENLQAASTPVMDEPVMDEPGTLVLSVPKMLCEYTCFPSVKEILQASDAVQEVELAEQKEEGTIDNRQVIVTYQAGFDVSAAIALLDRQGFERSDVAE